MSVQSTSKAAYWDLVRDCKLGERQALVFEALRLFGCANDRTIAEHTKLKINSVTGRRNELVDKGLVVEAFRAKDPETHKTTIYWMIKK